jgi:hypothetical protein
MLLLLLLLLVLQLQQTGACVRAHVAAQQRHYRSGDAAAVCDWRATEQTSCSTDANCVKEALLFTSVHSTLPATEGSSAALLYTDCMYRKRA